MGTPAERFYEQWSRWIRLPLSKPEALDRIKQENIRNFNSELIERLKEDHKDLDVDVNKPIDVIMKLLRGANVDSERVQQILKEMGGGIYR